MIAHLRVKLKRPLEVSDTTLAEAGLVLDAYVSPIFPFPKSWGAYWVVLIADKVLLVFSHDVELLTAERIPLTGVPDSILKYIRPDHRGFPTMPYLTDDRVYRSVE